MAKKKAKNKAKPKKTVKRHKKTVKKTVKKKTVSHKPKKKPKTSKKPAKKNKPAQVFKVKEPERVKRKGRAVPQRETFHITKPTLLEETQMEKSEVLMKMDKFKNGELEKNLLKEDDKKAQEKKEKVGKKVENHEEEEVKDLRSTVQKIKSFMTYFFVVLVFIIVIAVVVSLIGIKDLKDDETYLIVVDHNGDAEVGSLYHIKTKTHDTVNTGGYPKTFNPKELFEYAVNDEKGPKLDIDRVMVINHNSFERLSSATEAKFDGKTVTVDEMTRYFGNVRNLPNDMKANKAEWEVESEILGDWTATYHQNVWLGNEGHTSLLKEYRKNNIMISPTNGAMFMVKLCPVEKIIEWI